MRFITVIMLLALIAIAGCAPAGGQAVVGYATKGGEVTMYVYIVDGGTDLGGLFYRPSGGTLVRDQGQTPTPTTQPGK